MLKATPLASGNSLLFVGVIILGMTRVVLIVNLELFGSFGVLIGLTHGCLILTVMLIVAVIIVIFGTGRWVLSNDQSLERVRGCQLCV